MGIQPDLDMCDHLLVAAAVGEAVFLEHRCRVFQDLVSVQQVMEDALVCRVGVVQIVDHQQLVVVGIVDAHLADIIDIGDLPDQRTERVEILIDQGVPGHRYKLLDDELAVLVLLATDIADVLKGMEHGQEDTDQQGRQGGDDDDLFT